MKCKFCGKETVIVDYPFSYMGKRFHIEDTEWAWPPEESGDPGVLAAKSGSVPASHCEREMALNSTEM